MTPDELSRLDEIIKAESELPHEEQVKPEDEFPKEAPAAETTPEKPSLEQRLSDSRITYLSARQKLDDSRILRGLLVKKETRDKIEAAHSEAEKKYIEARAEFVGHNVDRYIEEREKLTEGHLEAALNKKEHASAGHRTAHQAAGLVKKLYGGWQKFNQKAESYNALEIGAKIIGKEFKAKGRFAKMANGRTAISLTLLGAGFGLGATTAAGMGILSARRAMSGAATAEGSYGLAMAGREKFRTRPVIEAQFKDATTAAELGALLDSMVVRNSLDGRKGSDLGKDELFQKISAKFNELSETGIQSYLETDQYNRTVRKIQEIEAEATAGGVIESLETNAEYQKLKAQAEQLRAKAYEDYFEENFKQAEENIKKSKVKEKLIRAAIGSSAIGLGVFIGSGQVQKLFGHHVEKPTAHTNPTQGKISASHAVPQQQEYSADHSSLPKTANPELSHAPTPVETPAEQPGFNPKITGDFSQTNPEPGLKLPKLSFMPHENHGQFEPNHGLVHNLEHTELPKSPDLVIPVGSHGFEGTLLDLKDSQPEQYAKMISWLENQPYNHGVTDPGALVHRYVLDYAHTHGMTIDTAGKDLSRVFQGQVHLHADGSIGINESDIKFVPEHLTHGTAPTEAYNQGAHHHGTHHTETIEPRATIDTHAAGGSTSGASPNYDGFAHAPKDFPGLDNNPVHLESHYDSGSETAAQAVNSATEILLQARDTAANGARKASEGLKIILGEGSNYKKFLKDAFGISPKDLDKMSAMRMRDFAKEMQTGSSDFRKKFQTLFDSLSDQEKGSDGTIRKHVLEVAADFSKK